MREKVFLLCMFCSMGAWAQQVSVPLDVQPSAEGVIEPREDSTLLLFPNPTSGRFFVHWGNRSLMRVPVEVRAMDGRLVRLDAISTNDEIDLSTLPDGTYGLYLMDLIGLRAYRVFRIAH